MTRVIIVLLLSIGIAGFAIGQTGQATTVFSGRPELKIEENALNRSAVPLPRSEAVNFDCIISEIDGKYYWASRENKRLLRSESGIYITFTAMNGSGYIRLINPDYKDMAAPLGKLLGGPETKFTYVEHLLLMLSSITYYGTTR